MTWAQREVPDEHCFFLQIDIHLDMFHQILIYSTYIRWKCLCVRFCAAPWGHRQSTHSSLELLIVYLGMFLYNEKKMCCERVGTGGKDFAYCHLITTPTPGWLMRDDQSSSQLFPSIPVPTWRLFSAGERPAYFSLNKVPLGCQLLCMERVRFLNL